MASPPSDQPFTAATTTPRAPQQTGSRPTSSGNGSLSTSPVEMRTLPTSTNTMVQSLEATPNSTSTEVLVPPKQEQDTQIALREDEPAPPTIRTRTESDAIGPSTDIPTTTPDTTNGPVVVIMLLLITGARHPYKIDERYLKKRNITVDAMDPYNISVYTLKELIWRDWREEWETRPTSPSSIRLIHFGRMLDDKSPLKDCRFNTGAPNVVHMTVKPQEVIDEEDAKTGKGGARRDGDEDSHASCRCVIL